MKIIEENYNDYIDDQVLSIPSYDDASKVLSFTLRNNETNRILAYASLKHENLDDEEKGCQIIGISLIDSNLEERFYDTLKNRVIIWCNDEAEFSFNYLWFRTEDIDHHNANKIIENIEGFEYIETFHSYVFKIERNLN